MINKNNIIFSIKVTSIFTVVGILVALLVSCIFSFSSYVYTDGGQVVLMILLIIIPILFLLTGIVVSQIHICKDNNTIN